MSKKNNPLIRIDYDFYNELKIISKQRDMPITKITNSLVPVARIIRRNHEDQWIKKIEPRIKEIFFVMGSLTVVSWYYVMIYGIGILWNSRIW